MKRKVAQRRTQCAYAHARSHSGSEECDKVRRTGHTLCSAGVPRVTLPCSLQIAAIARRAQTCLVQIDMVEGVPRRFAQTGILD